MNKVRMQPFVYILMEQFCKEKFDFYREQIQFVTMPLWFVSHDHVDFIVENIVSHKIILKLVFVINIILYPHGSMYAIYIYIYSMYAG